MFQSDQICSLFTFIARLMSRNRFEVIHLDRTLLRQLLHLVCTQSAKEVQVRKKNRHSS